MLNIKNSSLNDYEIIKEIGKGSFSNVYLVKKIISQKEFALKKVNIIKLSEKERQNSLKEVNFLSDIKDPNVIGYEESFYDENFNYLYLVMEYAQYGDLSTILQKRKKFKKYYTENELLNIYLQIASGLKAIHAKQIIHRDLKSANIFITQTNELILKIGDFNVSKKIDYLNLKNTQTGTPYYASPEIWENRPYDFKSDIWSLGCLFYEIASFSTPFKGNNMKELYENILKGNIAPLPKQYSNNILKIIKMCLRQDANLRPNINDIKFYIENLKLEQHFKKVFDENLFDINYNNYNNMNYKTGVKRQFSYVKPSGNLLFEKDNIAFPEFEKLNLKLKKDLTPIKQSLNYNINNLLKDKPRMKLAGLLNINLNLINNKKKINYNNNIYKTEKNLENKNTFDAEKRNYNIKFKPPPYKRLKIINTELEEINKNKEERKDNNYYKGEFSSKFNNIKNPLMQTNGKSSTNNSQSIPEIINQEINNKKNENIKSIKDSKFFNQEFQQKDINNNKINYYYTKEKEKNLCLKEKYDKDILLLLKPSKIGFKKKLNNLSTLNLNKRPITSLLTHNNIINSNNKISLNKEEENDNNNKNNNLNKNINLSKIKLKPIVPSKRAITPFIDNIKRTESINIKKKLKYNFSTSKYKSVNDNITNDNTINIINNKNKDKKFFVRKLNFDKSKITLGNNLSPIKTKFRNFVKPNLKNLEIVKLKTEI